MDSFERTLQRRSRILIHSLIISGTLNIALMATFMTFVLKERKGVVLPTLTQERVKEVILTNREVLESFRGMRYEELVRELFDETHVEEGQRRCDLALAFLAAFHHFDIDRAFSGFPMEKRAFQLEGETVTLFPGLSKERLEAIRTFARTEVWPLTPKGLFQEIRNRETFPQSLIDAFKNTNEYFAIYRAFQRLPYAISDDQLLSLVTKTTWDELQAFSDELKTSPTGSPQSFAPFLTPIMENKSSLAAYLLVLLDKEYALRKLSDQQMEILLSLLTDRTPEIDAFLAEVKGGIRSDTIQELAGKPPENPPRAHIVQTGDSLWKISRAYGVKVDVIKEMNQLESETLKVGSVLTLPPKEGDPDPQSAKDYTSECVGLSDSSL
ncbi:MAG: LysM peptidoglycan-binding domain-containing protein [Chlamydiales bacterium]|nr:LysM peptidoglycan-binding domain-containing protein [Chlamydiales bacterium]